MKPHALYVGPLKELHTLMHCACGELIRDGDDWCSDPCAEIHHKGDLPAKAPCTCAALIASATHGFGRHAWDCPRYVPHPEDFTHPLETL